MTADTLEFKQSKIHERIRKHAVRLGYDPDVIEPIYDGVVDAYGYLDSSPRLMWILKEPYDDFDDDGNPIGGGWTMFADIADDDTLADVVNRGDALRNVAYASYAIHNGIDSYEDLPWISDEPEIAEEMRRVAYVNIGKMPGRSYTSDKHLARCYGKWSWAVFNQIDLYDPDVLIFCGTATLRCFEDDMGLDLSSPLESVERGKSIVDIHEWGDKGIVWAPHPAARIPPCQWVDSVIDAINRAC